MIDNTTSLIVVLFCFVLFNGLVSCQSGPFSLTETNSHSVPIPDRSTATSPIDINDFGTFLNGTVNVNVTHTFVGDLIIELISPSGTTVELFDQQCGADDNIFTTFSDFGVDVCQDTSLSIPDTPLSTFRGENIKGDWILTVTDDAGGDTGTLNSWGSNIFI
eukprot:TRINITY_DN13064_c0_g1_i1.p1 TRINITY_DN13064_c0_g1~~TRINITY_DN13064_c0_g1_i1.p1  ORF type:complete len:162 (+),score=25.53 TRINITY_DN13064_c0_g1_i1:17-502(+)